MADIQGIDSFTTKHGRLMRIAAFANAFAWIVLVVNILWMGASFMQDLFNYNMMSVGLINSHLPSFLESLLRDPLYMASTIVGLAGILFRGVVYWLILKGIAVGLNMIVETDLNYRDGNLEVSHE